MVAPRPEEGGWEGHLASRGSVHEQRGGAVGGARRKDSGQPTPPGPSDTFWGTGGAEAHSSEHGVDGKGREGKVRKEWARRQPRAPAHSQASLSPQPRPACPGRFLTSPCRGIRAHRVRVRGRAFPWAAQSHRLPGHLLGTCCVGCCHAW